MPSGGNTRVFLVHWMTYYESLNNVRLLSLSPQLVILPYVVWIISLVVVVVVGSLDPASVSRKTFYCVVDRTGLTIFLGIYSAICCIAAFVLEGNPFITVGSPPPCLTAHPSTHRYQTSP